MRRRWALLGVAATVLLLLGYCRYEPPSYSSIAVSPDERLVALTVPFGTCAAALAIYSPDTSAPLAVFSHHPGKLIDSVFSGDGTSLLVLEIAADNRESKLLRLDLASWDVEVLRAGPGEWRDMDISPSGNLVVLLNYLETERPRLRRKSVVEVVNLSSGEAKIVYSGTTRAVSQPRFDGEAAVSFVSEVYDELEPDHLSLVGEWVRIDLRTGQRDVLGRESITAFPMPAGELGYILSRHSRGSELVLKSRDGIYSRLVTTLGFITNYRISPDQTGVYLLATPFPRPFRWSFIGAPEPEALKVDLARRTVRPFKFDRPILIRSALCL